MLNFDNVPKLQLIETTHTYYYLDGEKKVYLNDYMAVSSLVNEWYYLKTNFDKDHIPYHWRKQFCKLHSDNYGMVKGSIIHKQIENNILPQEFDWIKAELPQVKGKVEFGMFLNNEKLSIVGSCDLLNIENGQVVIYEYKNSYNPKTQKYLIEKGKKQLFLYGYLCFQNFKELQKDAKIKLVLMVFEHFNKKVLKFEYLVNLQDIIEESQDLRTMVLTQRDLLKQKKIEYAETFKVEKIAPLIEKYYAMKNDLEFQQKLNEYKNLELEIKNKINNSQDIDTDLKFINTVANGKIVGYEIREMLQVDKSKYIFEMETILDKLGQTVSKDKCKKAVKKLFWKELK